MGNSEVGHLNIGAGRVIFQELVKINLAISEHTLDSNSTLLETFEYCKKNGKALHLMGLLSDGCIHSSEKHLFRLIELANENGINEFYVHAFTDGRDTDPKSGLGFIKQLQEHLKKTKGKLASVVGRYYAMDRDKRWE
jgi:2,3-bisphosphoglycerate-independent phosphoglycerate mutase